jgi:hypothetical protein
MSCDNSGRIGDIVATAIQTLFKICFALNRDQLSWLIGHKRQLSVAIRKAIASLVGKDAHLDLVSKWERFYQDVIGMKVSFYNLIIPFKPEGDYWLIVVAQGITYNKKPILIGLQKLFEFDIHPQPLSKVIDMSKEQRTADNGPYAIWVRATVEADYCNVNKSADDLKGTSQITLIERFLLEGIFCYTTGEHLDFRNWTLCAGSRNLDGNVPRVSWFDGARELRVFSYDRNDRFHHLRSRSVHC